MQPFDAPALQPVQGVVNVQVVTMSDGTHSVALTIADVTGRKTMFLNADGAFALAKLIRDSAAKARSGLIVAKGKLPPFPPPPVNGSNP